MGPVALASIWERYFRTRLTVAIKGEEADT